jgi:hypothetical protein
MTPTNRPWPWIASLTKRRASTRPGLASGAHSAVGRPARVTSGLAPAATSGTRLTREECAPPAFISGLRHNAFRVPTGRYIRLGIRIDSRVKDAPCGEKSFSVTTPIHIENRLLPVCLVPLAPIYVGTKPVTHWEATQLFPFWTSSTGMWLSLA